MLSGAIRVKKPAWVRIVNPDPFEVLGRTYRYGDVLKTQPGGRFIVLDDRGPKALAVYKAPRPPTDDRECPSDALAFQPLGDLRLSAAGLVSYEEPSMWTFWHRRLNLPFPSGPIPHLRALRAAAAHRLVEVGDVVLVPCTCQAEQGIKLKPSSATVGAGPYRARTLTFEESVRTSAIFTLRRGGRLRVTAVFVGYAEATYQAAEGVRDEQCPDGVRFRFRQSDLLLLRDRQLTLRAEEEREIGEIRRILRSL